MGAETISAVFSSKSQLGDSVNCGAVRLPIEVDLLGRKRTGNI
jgi:hypothetical protein